MELLPVALAFASVSTTVSGVALVLRRRGVTAASLLVLAGAVGMLTAVLLASGLDTQARVAGAATASLVLPLALATYPVLRWRHPVDFVALVVVFGCGLTTTVYAMVRIADLISLVEGCVLIAYIWWRIETCAGRERRALVWMALGVSTALLVYGFAVFSSEGTDTGVVSNAAVAVFAIIGPAMYVGVTLPNLVDVRGVVVTVVVYAVALVTVMSVFVLALSLVDLLGGADLNVGALALLAAMSATVFHPTRVVLRGVVDQILFGERPDPLGAASQVATRIGEDPLPALRAIREALVVPYAALSFDHQVLAASGTATTHTRTLDLDGLGELVVGLRPGDLTFSSGDEQVLRLTVPLLAQTLRARNLTAELIESRGQTIAAVEEERRRLRRELHDGLGPRLTGVAFTSDAARNLVRSDPEAAEEMLAQLRADTVIAIEEIRRMVYAMRPPALDELGLVPALRQQATGLRNKSGEVVTVDVAASDDLPDLPAAVEVAAYRIVVEALTNVARHSDSASASVRLRLTADTLHVEVSDVGLSTSWRPGVGLSSMHERAAELGGSLEAGPGPLGGRVAAALPL